MSDQDSLRLARRKSNEAIEHLDDLESQSTATVFAVAALTGARLAINARLTKEDEGA